jgi:hypothetical protein
MFSRFSPLKVEELRQTPSSFLPEEEARSPDRSTSRRFHWKIFARKVIKEME